MTTDALRAELELALSIYGNDRLQGSAEALRAVIAHLRDLGIEDRLRMPLYNLLGELADSEKQENAEKSVKAALDGATAAAAVELCKRAGDEVERIAIPKVARATGGALSASQLTNLRKNMSRGRGRRYATAREHYEGILRAATANEAHLSAREIADRAIELVRVRFVPASKA